MRPLNVAVCNAAEELFTGLAGTGRSNTFVSAHIPFELKAHFGEVPARSPGLAFGERSGFFH